ncbi:hypothetical protein OG417_39230 [Actinoallomurus sp. NBC_01490]|jgi:hypothetical protein|uniref:hypothetical protein n=1 Tax=Actinoallomurus sp. NBC_01490 TaxID=2903557 RepID=UPI002E302FDC|nr:hypothetical protein [Actinoallomurus sp. NBC_01490]
MSTPDDGPRRPAEKLTALRLGRPLAVEVPAGGPGRRAFVTIRPVATPADHQARQEGWQRADHAREYRLTHWDYDADQIDGFDYDLGAILIQDATATDEAELITILQAWSLRPDRFLYLWQTDDPT